MDLISLYYFQELFKDLNMTKTAQRLYISQQTLSNHIQRLEQYYGTPLLYRKPALALTCAGEFVLGFAQVVEKEERNLKDILSDIEHQERGVVRIGASMARGTMFLPRILPQFHRRYPKVEVRFLEGLSSELEARISGGELDFVIVLSERCGPDLVEHDLLTDQVYLCVPESLLRQHYSEEEIVRIKEESARGANIRSFSRVPFALMTNRLGKRIWECFQRESITPTVSFTGPSTGQILPLCMRGICACYCTHMSLVEKREQLREDINVFPLVDQGQPVVQRISLLRHKQRYLTHFSKYFMELLFDTVARMEKIQVVHTV